MVRTNILVFLGFFSMTWVVAIFSGGTTSDVMLAGVFCVCAVISLLFPFFQKEKKYTSHDKTVSIKRFTTPKASEIFPWIESKIFILKRCRMWNENMISTIIPMMGISVDSEKAATRATRLASVSLFPAVILGIYAGLTISEIFLAICIVPIVIFFAPYLSFRFQILERKIRIEEEMAYFLVYANIMQTVGMGLYHSFKELRGQKVFPGMEADAIEIVKRVEIIGVTQNESLDRYAKSHPSRAFGDFISGYIAKITSVGNVPAYTESKARYFFDEYIGKWKRYEKSAQEIFAAIIMIAVVMPMVIMLISMLGGPQSSQNLLMIGNVISPIVSVLMIVMLNSSQPATGTKIKISIPPIVAGIVVGFAMMVAGIDPAISIASAALVGAVANNILVRNEIAKTRAIDSMLPEFMRDVTEMSKTGSNISQIVTIQSGKKAYKKEFNRLLEGIARLVRTGMPFDVASRKINTESIHVKFIMFILSKTYVSGGGSTDVFNTITEFVSKITMTKSEVTKSLRTMSGIVYVAPFLMLGIAHMMVSMFTADASTAPSSISGTPFAGLSIDESILDGMKIMTVMTVIPIGAVAAKITSYTVKDMMPVAIVSASTIVALIVIPQVFKVVTF